jgi:hypothetical protein
VFFFQFHILTNIYIYAIIYTVVSCLIFHPIHYGESMKKLTVLVSLVAPLFLAACGGGRAPATFTHVETLAPASAAAAPAPASAAASSAAPSVAPTLPPVPVTKPTDATLTGVSINVKRTTVNVGERGINLAAFTTAFDKDSGDASIQELVFRNTKGGNMGDLFSTLRFVDSSGDVCPQYSCYVQWNWNSDEARVVFTYGWRPTDGELKVYALQGDVSPQAPSGSTFAFELIGVQMRQWGKTVDGAVVGKPLEATTIVALPTVVSPIALQTSGAIPGQQYKAISITAMCPASPKGTQGTGCVMKELKLFVENGEGLFYEGYANLNQQYPGNYAIELNHWFPNGTSVTWTFGTTATNSVIYAQAYDYVFTVDGMQLSPIVTDPSMSCTNATTGQTGQSVCVPGGGKG